MIHIHYDFSLIVGSIILAILICYLAISIEQLLFRELFKKYKKTLLVISGFVLGAAIWCTHLVGILASQLPVDYVSDYRFIFVSYIIAFIASTFTVWLITKETLPFMCLILGALLMGLGISGMHYVGMMGLVLDQHKMHYDPLLMLFSVLIAITGSGLTLWLTFKYKSAVYKLTHIKLYLVLMLAFTIVAMHYTGMAALSFDSINTDQLVSNNSTGQGLILFTIVFISSLILVATFCVAVLEQRLEARNKQLSKVNRELANRVVEDNLTKLPNRLFLAEYSHFLFTEHRYRDDKIAFLYIDLDRFKAVNDVFGHHVGDQLLVLLAARIHSKLKANEKLLRIGGDEFLMVLERATIDTASETAEEVLGWIQDSFLIAGKEINISSSIGIAMYPDHANNLQDLLINADAAMLTSKNQGRNTYSFFNFTADQQEAKSQTKLINDLYKAVEEQQFVLFYQPKFTTKNREICGVEALIRWNHPSLGLLAPNMFIPGAEKTGLIIPMGYWALEQACKQIQIWEQNGSNYFPVAVNLSAVQFEHKHLFSTLEGLFQKYQIKPNHLAIEITESTAMHHIDASIRCFNRLRQMGIKLAIDDFGTGHSSFLYLKNLPVDELKIDREFIKDLSIGSKDEMILASIIQLAIKLGLVVTAEGVETPLQAEILTRLGCQQLQGYLLGMPVKVDHLEEIKYTFSN